MTASKLAAIKAAVCDEFHLRAVHFEGKTRARDVVIARWVFIHLAREMTGHTFEAIAERLGGRDHSTAMHGAKRAKALIATDPVLAERVRRLAAGLDAAGGADTDA